MSLCVRGMSMEFMGNRVAVNALWPKTSNLCVCVCACMRAVLIFLVGCFEFFWLDIISMWSLSDCSADFMIDIFVAMSY